MATIKTAQHGNSYCPQAQFDVVESSSTGGAVTYAWTLKWVTHGYTVTSSASKAYTAKIDGATVASGSFAIGGKSSTTIASGTYTINKGTSSRSVPIYLSFAMTFTWSGTGGSTKTASGSFTIAAKTSYTISYNANGGSGAPSSQTKWYDETLTLTSSVPSRTGHWFSGWNTNSSGTGTIYSPGSAYIDNTSRTFYAMWTAHTYTISYNANGGSGAPGSQTKTYGVNLTLSSTKPTRTNYNFLGWSTSASGSVVYAAGATYTNNSAVTLYAIWQLAYVKPRISNFNAYRCNSSGTASETGTYIKVTFNWATDYTMTALKVEWKTQTGGTWSSANASGTGTASAIIGSGGISTETSYHVRAYVSDSGGTTYSTTASIGTVKFPIDVKSGGTGVAIGKVAETDNLFDVGFPAKFRSDTVFDQRTRFPQGTTVTQLAGGYGTSGYMLACRFTIARTYANQYIWLKVTQRSRMGDLKIMFSGSSTNDAGLSVFSRVGNIGAYMYKSATSTWDLYISKSESYDEIEVVELHKGKYMDAVTITWINTVSSSLPSGYITASNDAVNLADRSLKLNSWSSGSDTASTAGWYLVASKNMSSYYEDVSATLLVTQQYSAGGPVGILRFKCRRNTESSPYFERLTWLSRSGWSRTDACGVVSGTTIQIYIYTGVAQYSRIGVTVLEDAYRGGNGNLVLHNSTAPTTGLSNTYTAGDNMTFHPVGTVVIMSSNTNPSNYYGGTWELIDKEFAPGDNIGGWTVNSTNCSASDYDFTRAGHSLFFSGGVTSAIQWNDDDVHVGTVNFSSCGVSRLGSDCWFVGYTDAGNSGLMMKLKYDNGQLIIHDNFGDSYISAGRVCKWSFTVTVPMAYMLDAACNKFYFKRTA